MDQLIAVVIDGLIIGLERRDHAVMSLFDPPQLRFRNALAASSPAIASSVPMTLKV